MTRTDKTRQLTVQQRNAIDMLIAGKTDLEVSQAVGVARQTVTEWRNHNALFAAELNRQREELWAASKEALRRLVADAVKVISDDLAAPERRIRQQAAVHVLRAVGLYGSDLTPRGATEPESVEAEWRRDDFFKSLEDCLVP
ncbi:MAG: hypothetical protein BWY79_00135 [Actinobacteria bacterium ADurb.Bin444]|nr:MAG: hypothetical protein BWY79_00135 [Actinobacteria bacterium ADurb.Bin444]